MASCTPSAAPTCSPTRPASSPAPSSPSTATEQHEDPTRKKPEHPRVRCRSANVGESACLQLTASGADGLRGLLGIAAYRSCCDGPGVSARSCSTTPTHAHSPSSDVAAAAGKPMASGAASPPTNWIAELLGWAAGRDDHPIILIGRCGLLVGALLLKRLAGLLAARLAGGLVGHGQLPGFAWRCATPGFAPAARAEPGPHRTLS